MMVQLPSTDLRQLARASVPAFLLLALICAAYHRPVFAQSFSGTDRDNGQQMLRAMKDDLKKHYYDINVRGIDLESRFKQADERVKNARSNGEIMGIVAQVLLELDDSHTFFLPPRRTARCRTPPGCSGN